MFTVDDPFGGRTRLFTTRPTLQGTHGMAASTHWLASATAMAVLEDDGNAFDAAVAAGFVLHVVEPHLNGPAGEVPIIFAPAGGEPVVLCGQGPAPAGATIEHYRGLGLDLVPGTGPLASAVPGAFDAWLLLLRDHGTKELAELLKYAIGYAAGGYPAVARIGQTIEVVQELFETEWHSSAQLYLPDGKPPAPGALLRNPALAETWRRVLAEVTGPSREARIDAARRVWREGFIAEELAGAAAQSTMDSSGERHAGTLTGEDIAAFTASYEQPVSYQRDGWTVCKAGLWSQGPVLLQQLALLPDELDPASPEYLHTLIEGTKLAMADREAWYGDRTEVTIAELLDPGYNAKRRALIGEEASRELRPGHPGGRAPQLSEHAHRVRSGPLELTAPAGSGEPTVARTGETRGDTCHVDVVDRWGNMIAATPSGGWLHSNPVIPALGFPLGTRLQMAWLDPGLPNSLSPGKRPRTTLSPSLALRGGEPVLAFGTPGGDQQDQWSTHFFLAVTQRDRVRGGYDLQGAIDAPNWHTESFPGSFYPRAMKAGAVTVESRIGSSTIDELRRRGHDVTVGEPWSEGRLSAVARDPETGLLSAAANPRGMQGYAAGR